MRFVKTARAGVRSIRLVLRLSFSFIIFLSDYTYDFPVFRAN